MDGEAQNAVVAGLRRGFATMPAARVRRARLVRDLFNGILTNHGPQAFSSIPDKPSRRASSASTSAPPTS